MNQLWQMWASGLPKDKIQAIQDYCYRLPLSQATIGADPDLRDSYRSSQVGWVNRYSPESQFIKDIIWTYVMDANRNAFGFKVDYLADMQYTVYYGQSNDKYDWHIDTFWANPTSYDRKLSFILQLSDPSEYEGGDFQFDPEIPQPDQSLLKQQGTILVFPSFIRHRVIPVTSGTRRSLVAWAEGPKFA